MQKLSTKIVGLAGATMMFAGMAFGQATCASSAGGPLAIRAESTNDLSGDIYVTCTASNGFTVAAPGGTVNIQLFAPTGVTFTSRVIDSTNGYTEAVAYHAGPTAGGAAATTPALYNAANAVLGTISPSGNSLNFIGIPIPALAATQGIKIEISNIRVNPSGLTVTNGAPPTINLTPVVSGGSVFQSSLSSQQVGYVQFALGGAFIYNGLTAAAPVGAKNFSVCKTILPNAGPNVDVTALIGTIRVVENFTSGFRSVAMEGSTLQFGPGGVATPVNPASAAPALTTTNAASSNTRFKFTFANVPPGVSLYTVAAPIASTILNVVPANTAKVTYTTSETGAFAAATPVTLNSLAGFAAIPVSAGTATAVFDVSTADSGNLDNYLIPVYAVAATPGSIAPTSTPITITVSMAPTGAPTNIPNFNASAGSTVALKGSTFNACSTSLLFPFVTNILGFDTGIAIANTATDPFGTAGAGGNSGGTCTLNFYGAGAPTATPTPNVPSGSVFTQVISGVAPGFQGYMIAQCTFQYAHGFAFITNGIGPNGGLSQGYLAGVIPDVNQVNRAAGTGEVLGN